MTIEEILKLGAMGFTKEDIEKMDAPQQEPEKAPEPEQAEPEPEKKEEPAKAEPEQDILKFIAGEFDKLNKSIQLANINRSDIDKPNVKTADEVMAELLAPPKKGGKL